MKKVIAVCIALIICMSMAACTNGGTATDNSQSGEKTAVNREQQVLDEADALVAEGKYQEAIDLLENVESYKAIAQKISDIKAEKDQASRADMLDQLVGRWVREDTTYFDYGAETWEFCADGTLQVTGAGWDHEGSPNTYDWTVEDGMVSTMYGKMKLVESNGMQSLIQVAEVNGENGMEDDPYITCFIRETDYENKFVTVDLTMENVNDYIQLDAYGEQILDEAGNVSVGEVMIGGKSKVVSEGLMYVGASNFTAAISTSDGNGTYEDYLYEPYGADVLVDNSRQIDGFLEVTGTLYFVKAEYVTTEDYRKIEREDFVTATEEFNRILTLDDGCRIVNYIFKDYMGEIPRF